MATNNELKIEQKRRLFQLLEVKRANKNFKNTTLDRLIIAVKAEMEQEDVAYVEKLVEELPEE